MKRIGLKAISFQVEPGFPRSSLASQHLWMRNISYRAVKDTWGLSRPPNFSRLLAVVSRPLVSCLGNIFNISWPQNSPSLEGSLRGGVGGRVITFGDNRTNNHPHPVSPPQGGGNKTGSFIKVFLKHYPRFPRRPHQHSNRGERPLSLWRTYNSSFAPGN
jgi:hypothetical protein